MTDRYERLADELMQCRMMGDLQTLSRMSDDLDNVVDREDGA